VVVVVVVVVGGGGLGDESWQILRNKTTCCSDAAASIWCWLAFLRLPTESYTDSIFSLGTAFYFFQVIQRYTQLTPAVTFPDFRGGCSSQDDF
jgi:hypothetical protein